jgi:type II secretory pathway component PulL
MARFHATSEGNVPFTPEEEAERDVEEAAWLAGENDRQAEVVRAQRDVLLAATDWRVTKAAEVGSVLDPAWIIYRQALRNVPEQSGFPWEVSWPSIS